MTSRFPPKFRFLLTHTANCRIILVCLYRVLLHVKGHVVILLFFRCQFAWKIKKIIHISRLIWKSYCSFNFIYSFLKQAQDIIYGLTDWYWPSFGPESMLFLAKIELKLQKIIDFNQQRKISGSAQARRPKVLKVGGAIALEPAKGWGG